MASTPTAEPYVRPRQRTVWFAVRAGCARLRAVLAAQAHKAWGHGIVELSCAGRAGCFVAACRPRATADRTRCTPVWPFLALNALSALANCTWHGTYLKYHIWGGRRGAHSQTVSNVERRNSNSDARRPEHRVHANTRRPTHSLSHGISHRSHVRCDAGMHARERLLPATQHSL